MRNNQLLLTIFVSLFCFQKSSAQSRGYKAMMADFNTNFYTVCDSFEAYFKNRNQGKGTGYKSFLRWKNDNESKYYPSGNRMVDHFLPLKEFERINNAQKNYNKLFQTGGWQSLGPDSISKITGHYAAGLGRVEYVEVNKNNSQQI